MSDYLTLKQMAAAINLNYSTARNYVDQFQVYFHKRDLEGVRWPVHDKGDMEVLRLIKRVKEGGGQTHDVLSALEDRFGVMIEHPSPDNSLSVDRPITSGLAQTAELLRSGQAGIDYAISTIRFYKDLVEAKQVEINHLRAENDRLKSDGTGENNNA